MYWSSICYLIEESFINKEVVYDGCTSGVSVDMCEINLEFLPDLEEPNSFKKFSHGTYKASPSSLIIIKIATKNKIIK